MLKNKFFSFFIFSFSVSISEDRLNNDDDDDDDELLSIESQERQNKKMNNYVIQVYIVFSQHTHNFKISMLQCYKNTISGFNSNKHKCVQIINK